MRWLIGTLMLAMWACGGGGANAEQPAAAQAPAAAEPAAAEPATDEPAAAEPVEEPPAAPTAVDAPAPEGEDPEVAEAGDGAAPQIGVPACDEYLTKLSACIDSEGFPEAARDQTRKAVAQMVEQWRKIPEESWDGLGQACTAAMEAAKKSFGQFGCTF